MCQKRIKKAIQAFYDAGCRYLQLDDTAWAVFLSEAGLRQIEAFGTTPDESRKLFAASINDAIKDRPDDLKVTMHICRGNFQSTWTAEGGYDARLKRFLTGLILTDCFWNMMIPAPAALNRSVMSNALIFSLCLA